MVTEDFLLLSKMANALRFVVLILDETEITLCSKRNLTLNPKPYKQDMKRRGVDYVFVFSVDNPLCEVGDPVYIGCCIDRQVQMGYKVVKRRGRF